MNTINLKSPFSSAYFVLLQFHLPFPQITCRATTWPESLNADPVTSDRYASTLVQPIHTDRDVWRSATANTEIAITSPVRMTSIAGLRGT